MNCIYITKKGINCKFNASKQLDGLNYCTRHYNSLLKYSTDTSNKDSSKDSSKEKVDETKKPENKDEECKEEYKDENKDEYNCQINLYEEYLKIVNEKNNNTDKYDFNNIEDIKNILTEIELKFISIELINSYNNIYNFKVLINDIATGVSNYYNLKIQNLQKNTKNIIYYEYTVLKNLKDTNYVIKLCDVCKPFYNKNYYYSLLITELIYETLEDRKNNIITIDDIKEINIQIINIIQYIHDNKYLYLDLKPSNIIFISKDNNKIKLANFNCCNKYINIYSEFFENILLNRPTGNLLFSSININKSFSGTRIDDIESVLWLLSYCLDSKLYINLNKLNTSKEIIKFKERLIKENLYIDEDIQYNHNNKSEVKNKKYKCEYDFIIKYINELHTYNNLSNRKPNYNKFINIIEEA